MKRPLLYFAGGFVLGEVLGLRDMTVVKILIIITAVFLFMLICMGKLQKLRKISIGPWCGLVLLFLLAGYLRGSGERKVWQCEQALAETISGQTCCVSGIVQTLTERTDRLELVLQVKGLQVGEQKVEKTFRKVLVYLKKEAEAEGQTAFPVHCGMAVRVKGKLSEFEAASNPGQFDYRKYYRAQKLVCRISDGTLCETGKIYHPVKDRLWQFSREAAEILNQVSRPGDAGIFRAILLGDKTGLSAEIRERYQRNGIAHLLAISGLHLSMISIAVYGWLRCAGLGYGMAGFLGGMFLTAFGIMTGVPTSVLRALIMTVCGYLAAFLGRTYDLKSAWALAAILIFWDSPYQLTQSGAQLSFAAVGSLAFAAPRLSVQNFMTAGLSLQMITVPLILYHYFQIPLYGMLLNLVVVPLMSVVVLSGSLGLLTGAFSVNVGWFVTGGGHLILQFYDLLCSLCENLPAANLILGRPADWQMGVYYGLVLTYLYVSGSEETERVETQVKGTQKLPWRIQFLPLAFFLILLPLPVRGFETVFLDVGQGDGMLLRTHSTVILADCGSSSKTDPGKNLLEPFLKSRGISRVKYAFLSHADQDHINGITYLLTEGRDIRIDHVVLPAAGYGKEAYMELAQMARNHGAQVLWMKAGDELQAGNLKLTCWYPFGAENEGGESQKDNSSSQSEGDRNADSLVLLATYGNFRMLLTGDMGAEQEQELLEQNQKSAGNHRVFTQVQVLKTAHHGSRYSTSPEWLDALAPQFAILSYGKGNRYGHPHAQVLEEFASRGIETLETAKEGAIMLWTDGKKIRWKRFLR